MERKFVDVDSATATRDWLPKHKRVRPPAYSHVFDSIPEMQPGVLEKDLVEEFGRCLKTNKVDLIPGYKFVVIDRTSDKNDPEGEKVDAALFLENDAPEDRSQHWASQAIHFEFKRSQDAFEDKHDASHFESTVHARQKVRAQLVSYAAKLFSRQQRTFCFSVLVFGTYARVLRWDRAGAIVTTKFDYRKEPGKLAEFLWRFCQLRDKPALQGYDVTAERITEDSVDWKTMTNVAADGPLDNLKSHVYKDFGKSLDKSWPWWKLRVDEVIESPKKSKRATPDHQQATRARYYLVGKPHFLSGGMAGRGTRGYIAYDCETSDLVYLKDAWRVDMPGIQKEGDILHVLNKAGVSCIPTLVCHGDVLERTPEGDMASQTTETRRVWLKKHNLKEEDIEDLDEMRKPRIKRHTHYRLVVKEVGRSIKDFANSRHLIKLIVYCLTGHKEAYEKCRILHRDISVGNLLVVRVEIVAPDGTKRPKWVGILADWELSKPVRLDSEPVSIRQPDRTGTWQFMSGLLLANRSRSVELADEFEAFFNVILYLIIQFVPHTCSSVNAFIHDYFDGFTTGADGEISCGQFKLSTLRSGIIAYQDLPISFGTHGTHPLNWLISELLKMFHSRYLVETNQKEQQVQRRVFAQVVADESAIDLDDVMDEDAGIELQPTHGSSAKPSPSGLDDTVLAEHRTRMEKLRSHQDIIRVFDDALELPEWPAADRTACQFDPNWTARRAGRSAFSTTHTSAIPEGLEVGMDRLQLDDHAKNGRPDRDAPALPYASPSHESSRGYQTDTAQRPKAPGRPTAQAGHPAHTAPPATTPSSTHMKPLPSSAEGMAGTARVLRPSTLAQRVQSAPAARGSAYRGRGGGKQA